MTPYAFAKYRERKLATIRRLLEEIDETEVRTRGDCPKPRKPVRPATAKDLVPGAVIWHDCENFWHWQIVETAGTAKYTSVDGDNYHLRNAFVEEVR
jgi:hypothetical protein